MKEPKSRISSSLFVISLMLAACAPVLAQQTPDGLGGAFGTPAGATITKSIVDRIALRSRERGTRSGTSSTTRTSSGSVANKSETSVLFRPTGTQLKTREIADLIDAGNPQVFTILKTILTEFDKAASAAGHPNDLALALSFFLATNASIYHGAGQPADPQMVELRNAIADALVEDNALNGVTDRQKQEMYETLVLFTGFALAVYEEGKQGNNAETIKTSQQLAGQNLLAVIGISPDKINFSAQGLNIDNGAAAANDSGSTPNSSSAQGSAIKDPFPDRPGYAPQKPLSGTLTDSITMDDLVGKWDHGAGSVQTYVDSNTGNYAGTATSFYGEQYVIKSDGTFAYKFVGRAGNNTVREADRGTIILSGGYITFKFEGRATKKYQFIAFNIQPTGAAILSLVEVHDKFQGYDAAELALECGHGDGFIRCVGGEEWARLGNKSAEPAGITQSSQNAASNQDTAAATSTPAQSNTEPSISRDASAATLSSSDFLDFDPFPDKPHVQPQTPLIGRLRKTITMADLAGTWEIGGASVQEYVSSSTQSYSSVSFGRTKYTIRADGTYESNFQGRASNTTIRESDSGTIILGWRLYYHAVQAQAEPRDAISVRSIYEPVKWCGSSVHNISR